MKYKTILHEKNRDVCTITLNRPEVLNAINNELARELLDAVESANDDYDVRAVVLTGAGERAFSVGLDLKELVDAADGVEDIPTLLEIRRRVWSCNPWERLAGISKPTIAAISGFALGGGLELALACDIRIASHDATFGFPEVRLGIIPGRGGTQRLPRIVGRGKALEMLLTGETIDAGEAHRVELVGTVVAGEQLLDTARDLATKLAAHAPLAVRLAREAVTKGLDMTLDQGLRLETDLSVMLQTTEDRAEGIRSFVEKRKPKFEGR
ncbi:MAG: enoyl-CoA hydratase/isomerase family protein [Chloroflexi bacterium]|nr:enoyl-CoA hydratase/isomerase family protein [Chloroflexota bacterium]